jgi:hypothetical protein
VRREAFIRRLGFAAEVLRHGIPDLPPCPWELTPRPAVVARIPRTNPMRSDAGAGARAEAAMRMMDGDCYGFLLLSVHKEPVGVAARIRLAQHMDDAWWPAMAATLERVAAEVPR